MYQTLRPKILIVPPIKTLSLRTSSKRLYSSRKEIDPVADPAGPFDRYDGPIVISGISGRFPAASSHAELTEKLLNGEELTSETTTRWENPMLPKRFGFLHCLNQFDARFFGHTLRQAHQTDPQMRLLLEAAFEAIIDAGLSPTAMRGSRTAVFSGAYGGEAVEYNVQQFNKDNAGYLGLGSTSFMIPGRIAYNLDLQGPSSQLCTACSSSFTALETAVHCIVLGNCDAAIVTGSTLHLNPQNSIDLTTFQALAEDGRCKTFDAAANGFTRSEAAVAILIQKEKDAKRSYAKILSIRSNTDGFKHGGILNPSQKTQEKLLKESYNQIGMDPANVSYLEAHGTGTPLGDAEELKAIHNVFCKGKERAKPLLVGSIKTNLGHAEAAAGLCGLSKVIGAIQTGIIPKHLWFKSPKAEQEELFDGSFQIVTEPKPFDGGIVAISSFGIGGTNSHLILEPGPVREHLPQQHQIPLLIPFSASSAAQAEESIKEAAQSARNPEFLYLLHNAFQRDISGHYFRGFGLLKPDETEPTVTVQNYNAALRPVWVIFPGMGSQWTGMGQDLMRIEPFAESVNRSRATLKNLGVDLDQLLKEGNEAIFKDIHMAVLSITTMQIALYDTIKELGLVPDGFIGHSTGEFLCAYADGCFTAEETLLVTDARGRAFSESQKVVGAMASVGLSWEEGKERLPSDLELACHNAAENVTVSGPAESVEKFVEVVKNEGKFAAVVNSCGIAAHSKHVRCAADLLKKYVADIIKGERARSSRWISTSVAEAEWDTPLAKFASPEYFDNNLRAPVLFYEALQHVPSRSLVIEVSPKGFFQALLKETVPNDCAHVAPMTFKAEDKLEHFLKSIGQMYASGVDVEIAKLYPSVTLPVSSNTPSLAHLVKWNHETCWNDSVVNYPLESGDEADIDLNTPLYASIAGHKIENRTLLPATLYLQVAWMVYAYRLGQHPDNVPFQITNLRLRRATIIREGEHSVKLLCKLSCSTGIFQIESEGDIVASGVIQKFSQQPSGLPTLPLQVPHSDYLPMDKDDVYKEFKLRGYNYTGLYRGIQKIDNEGRWSDVEWTGDTVSFLDAMLQTSLLSTTDRHLAIPIDFERITVDPVEFKKHLKDPLEGQEYPTVRVVTFPNRQKIMAPGIEIKGLQPTILPRRGQRGNLALEKFTFCPFNLETSTDEIKFYIWEMVDLVLDNICRSKDLKVFDVFINRDNSLAKLYQDILRMKPMRKSDVRMLTIVSEAQKMDDKEKNAAQLTTKETKEELVPESAGDLVLLDDAKLLESIIPSIKPSGFMLLHSEETGGIIPVKDIKLISQITLASKTLRLFRKIVEREHNIVHVSVDAPDFSWVGELQETLKKPTEEVARIYVTSQHDPSSGVLGFVNCLRQEEGGERIRCIFDPQATLNLDFQSPDEKLAEVMRKDLVSTAVRDGELGTYRHISLETLTNGVMRSVEHAYSSTLVPGDLSSLRWIQSPLAYYKSPEEVTGEPAEKLYQVAYAALNFRDVLLATAAIPIQPQFSYKGSYLGFEFSGFDDKGNRVMGITHGKGLATSVLCDARFVWDVPQEWTLEEAATVPVAYATVLYAFHTRARLQPGQTVLIHAGTGGVGQAAISVALAHGCTVLTTVGTPEKREFIKKIFPQIKDEHIGNSRDTSFEDQFREATDGRGVDVVLNSLAGDKLHATLRCLAVNGKFLEIGVFDSFMNTPVGLRPFLNNIEFHGVQLYHIMGENLANHGQLKEQLKDGIKSGAIKPLNRHVFEKDQVEEAFRFMASGKHTGKILLRVRDENNWKEDLHLPAAGRCYFESDKAYIIVGGLGGLGLEVANWLVERGARHLVLISRSGVTTGYQSLCMRKWHELGIAVETPVALDLSDRQVVDSFLSEQSKEHKIGGIFNSAVVLKDEIFPNQTIQTFHEVSAPKAVITQNLDELSRKYCPHLDYFVVFSSFASGVGNAEQTNYGWANAVMERICENRMAQGLHGLAIQWGVVGQVGLVAEKILKNMDENTEIMGTLPQSVDSCLEVLESALLEKNTSIVSSMIVATKESRMADRGGLIARMQTIFGIKDIDSLRPDKKLSELGMDSLVAVELKQTLEREYDMIVTKELLLSLTVGDVKAIMDAGSFDSSRHGARKLGKGDIIVPFKLHDICLVKLMSSPRKFSSFLVHGLEGGSDIFKPLAEKLDGNVYGFQFTNESDLHSVSSIAERYFNELKAVELAGPYMVAGFSAGCTIAYEIVQKLLKNGDEQVQLVLLDGCPSYIGTDQKVKKSVALHLLQSRGLYSNVPQEYRKNFESSLTGEVEADTKLVMDLGRDLKDLKPDPKVVESYLQLGKSMVEYVPTNKFAGPVTLIQAIEQSTHAFGAPNEDFNVSKYCTGPVSRHKVNGDHWTFLSEKNVAETAQILIPLLLDDSSSETTN